MRWRCQRNLEHARQGLFERGEDHYELAGGITTRMSFEADDGVARYLELIFILRYLEQIGNLSTNLGEDTVLAFSKNPTKR
jgi:phosphate uptake regulator